MSTVTLDKLISDEQSIKAVLGISSNDNDNNEEDEEQVKKEEVWWLKAGKQWKLTNVAKNIYRNHLSCTGQQSVINAVKNLMPSDDDIWWVMASDDIDLHKTTIKLLNPIPITHGKQ